MDFISHLFFGFVMGLIGVSLPGMINMTSVGMSLRQGLKAGLHCSAGASTTIFFQAAIAIVFTGYLTKHPEIFEFLKKASIFIFLGLGGLFFHMALRRRVAKSGKRMGGAFFTGMAMAGMNIMNIPYYFTFSSLVKAHGLITLGQSLKWIFLLAAPVGALSLLGSYSFFARSIAGRIEFFSRNINFFLSGLFFLLALIQVIQFFT